MRRLSIDKLINMIDNLENYEIDAAGSVLEHSEHNQCWLFVCKTYDRVGLEEIAESEGLI